MPPEAGPANDPPRGSTGDAAGGPERLQKLLARAGYGGRRTAERLIEAGRVTVDGHVAHLGQRADPVTQRIELDGEPLRLAPERATLMLNKPAGYLVSAGDERGRPTVYDLLPGAPKGLRYVGRLDLDTEGLLLLTTDGDLAFRLAHPPYEVEKVYEATVEGEPSARSLDRLRSGVRLDDGVTAPAEVDLLPSERGHARLRIVIHEGRKRQVRRMCAAVGHRVIRLRRVAFGPLTLEGLREGASRSLTDFEVAALRALVGLEAA